MKCGYSSDLIHKDVVIIGNGPSGIALSYMLSGNIPYITSTAHPDELLSIRLEPALNQSLIEVNLPFLANGLEGRTTNPVSLLLDSLVHPCADIGLELHSMVEWRKTDQQFRKFGHICEIHTVNRELTNFRSTNPLRRWFNRLRMINETDQRSYRFLRSQRKIMHELEKLMEYPYIIHPFSTFRFTWDIIACIYILLQTIMIPLDIAFFSATFEYNMVHSETFKTIRILTDLASFGGIIVTFFCGYCDMKKNKIIVQPGKITNRYLSRNFILDFYSSIPFDLILIRYEKEVQSLRKDEYFFVAHYLGLIKLLRYFEFVQYTSRMFERTTLEIYYIVHRISIAIITFFIYLHVICCLCIAWNIYQITFHYQIAVSHALVKSYGNEIRTLEDMYFRFFYSGCLVAFNAGYGFPIYQYSPMIFTANVWICSRMLYIFAIAYFIQLQTAINSSAQKYVDMLCEVKDYMEHKQMPNFLQNRMLAYYDVQFQKHFYQETEILNTVSAQLRQEIAMNTCRKLIENVQFFRGLPETLIIRIVSALSYDVYLTNDVIAKVGTLGDCMYFISSGTIAMYSETGKELGHLHDGDHFGAVLLISKKELQMVCVIAAEVCELYRLERDPFIKAIMPYPDVYGRIIDHVVLGKGPPGGSWHSMDPDILTLSLGSWMSLPGMKYESKNSSERRATAKSVAEYYAKYVQEMGLSQNFENHMLVTKISPYMCDETECKSKWVEKVNSDICQKVRLCSRPERKKDIARCKTYSLSNAFNYILNRAQEPCVKRSWEQNDGDGNTIAHDDTDYTLRKKRDKNRSISLSEACELTREKCKQLNGRTPLVPTHRLRFTNSCYSSVSRSAKWIIEAIDLDTKECVRYSCNNLILANGSSDLPNKLNISNYKTDPYWLLHDLRSLEIELDLLLQNNPEPDPVLVVGAGLSAADAIIATKARNVPVVHLFRNKTDLTKHLPENMYPEYHKVHQMMKNGTNYPLYTALAEYTLTSLDEFSRKARIISREGKSFEIPVSYVIVLIGSRPDLSFLPNNFNLGVKKQMPIDGKKNTAHIDKFTHEVLGHDGLYAIGPLAGDNFVRFLPGGALAVMSDIVRKSDRK